MKPKILLPQKTENSVAPSLFDRLASIIPSLNKFVVFSPHLDDAVLSMGACLFEAQKRGISCEVVTFFTKSSIISTPLTKKLLQQSGFSSAEKYFEVRKQEDLIALKKLGVSKISQLDYADAAWRMHNNIDVALYPETTLNVGRGEAPLWYELTQQVAFDKRSFIFAPLGRGRHVDHILIRDVAHGFDNVCYYADFPYSRDFGNEDAFITHNHLTEYCWTGDGYEEKAAAIMMYASQTASLFSVNPMQLPFETFYL